MASAKILIVDDEPNIRFVMSELLKREGYATAECGDGVTALEMVREDNYDIVIMDIRMPRMDGLTALRHMKETHPDILVLIITAHGTEKTALEAVELGAYDYFTKPFDLNEVRIVLRRAVEKVQLRRSIEELSQETVSRYQFGNLVGQSPAMRDVYSLLQRVLDNDVSVLVTGESGTGKEVIASAIHFNSPRRKGPLIKVNTVAIPENLLESEMFGHERGAFTGAVQQKIGKFEAANGGTLFLDEIGDMPLPLQAKLLRVIQEREIERVGSTKQIKVDIRIVCATNRDLAQCVEKGTFREDLFYRINVMPIYLPPLRQRIEDIALLLDHFIEYYNPRLSRAVKGVSQGAMQKFLDYPWPGNVRELENMVQRTMLMSRGDTITVDDLPPVLRSTASAGKTIASNQTPPPSGENNPLNQLDLSALLDTEDFSTPLAERLSLLSDHVERYLIEAALRKAEGHRQETADLLGISRKSLHNKMVRYGMFDDE